MAVPQRPLRLLSLDGGGIRGLSTLHILESIMINLSAKAGLDQASLLRPCEYFDLVAGTSTGGLIAIMLGTLQMDIRTCIDEYVRMAPDIFPVESLIRGSKIGQLLTVARGRQRFQAEPLELAIKRLVKRYLGDRCTQGEETPLRFKASELQGDHACKVFVCVTSEKLGKHFQLRSYNSPWDAVDDCPIWQACRATSAAPTFFPPMQIGNPPVAYIDGGLGYNNPIRALIEEKSHIWPDRQIGCIVSIGTGFAVSRDVGRTVKPLFNKIKEMATDTEKVAREFGEEMKHKHGNEQKIYFRFSVQQGLEQVGLEEWKEMERIKVATHDYLKSHWSWIDACSTQMFELKVPVIPARGEDAKLIHYNTTREEAECLQSLWPSGIAHESQKSHNPKCVPNTCLRTLQNPKYLERRDDDTATCDSVDKVPPVARTNQGAFPQISAFGQGQQPMLMDALSYLDQRNVQFQVQPSVYNRCLGIIEDYKGQAIDTPAFIERILTLFVGYPEIIQGFKRALPIEHGMNLSLA